MNIENGKKYESPMTKVISIETEQIIAASCPHGMDDTLCPICNED